jgi:small-conductance mechanosensitive channel
MIATALAFLSETLVAALPGIVSGVAVIAGFWVAARVVRSIIRRSGRRLAADSASLVGLAATTAYWTLLIIGLVSGFGTMGVNVAVLVAGIGLTGFALGFALRDAVSNLLSGVLILVFRPFHVGSTIKVAGFSGTVRSIDLRYTTLAGEGQYILVPNKTMYTSPVTVIDATAGDAPQDGAGSES